MGNNVGNKRIIKNTGLLYIRMLLVMAVTLYISRIILNILGVDDYGIYNVVGSFVAMLSMLNSSMAIVTQRFLSFEIGKNDFKALKRIFSMSINIHLIIALVIFLLAETVGLWFINNELNLPPDRVNAALWVYQFSILTIIVNILTVPYEAVIIAREKMALFAYISIVDVCLKLFFVLMLQWFDFDKLKLYAAFMFVIPLVVRSVLSIYCTRSFSESKFEMFWDKTLFKKMIGFAGWSIWGSAASIMYNQGVNVLINIFFGPAVNAARGITYQVQGAVNNFVSNFQLAMRPQIIKSYASSDFDYMHQLIYMGSKYSFFLLYTLSLPILLETGIILKTWLKIVPPYTIIFTQLIIVNVLIDSISGTLMTASQASGKIKLYQGVVGGLLLLILPFSYIFLKMGFSPEITFYVSIFFSLFALLARLLILRKIIGITIRSFFKSVVLKAIYVSIIAIPLPYLVHQLNMPGSVLKLTLVIMASIISCTFTIYYIGLNKNERVFAMLQVKKYTKLVFERL